ncbi:hypothetical protein [Bacillus rubiinfantis]|uniref:hypothetical protein n=1 Tax=Bacillus rubiinfantis TaxID=1499680 RepID=UPI000694F299|nr:hypothetical protein [Bacillus rubiinfantis]
MNTQKYSIITGREEFTVNMVKRVAKEHFKLMKPMLEAIRSGNPYKIALYEDLRKMELTYDSVPKKEKSTLEKNSKVQQDTKEIPKSTTVSTELKAKKVSDFAKDDFRRLMKEANQNEKSIYQLLVENDYIDNMSFWQGEGS